MVPTLKGRARVYLDTSIPSAYWDDRDPSRRAKTREFWQQLPSWEVFVSAMTVAEVGRHPDATRRAEILDLLRPLTVLPVTPEAEALADEYLGREVFPRPARADAVHVAVATVHGVGILVSWNFRHMVRLRTRQLLAAINPLLGYPVLQIVSPLEV
jgi:predicted nucleic acid-binding protein